MFTNYSLIEKKYDFSRADRFATLITYDLPIHLSIRFDFEWCASIHRVGYDPQIDLDKTQVHLTIASNDGRVLVSNYNMTTEYYEPNGFPSRWDTVTICILVPNNSEPPMEIAIDFKNETSLHDRILIIGEEKFYVNSGLLSAYSDFFAVLFHGNFLEKDMKEITIKDVDPEDFEKLLKVVYPTRKDIDKDNVSVVWKLAQRFMMPVVADKCERFVTEIPGKYMLSLDEKNELAVFIKSEKLAADCTTLMNKMNLGE